MPDSLIYPPTHPKAVLEDLVLSCAARTPCPAPGGVTVDSAYHRGSAKLTLASGSLRVLVLSSFAEAPAVLPSPVTEE